MPVNVDTVYQTVQALANKEQRGYLTPQEFNLFANQAQADIFEQYFYDLGAFQKQGEQTRTVGDSITHIQHKLNNTGGVTVTPYQPCTYVAPVWTLAGTAAGRLTGRFHYFDGTERRELIPTPGHLEDLRNLRGSRWHSDTDEIFVFEDSWGTIQVHNIDGPITTGVTCETVEGRPGLVRWGYNIVNEKPLFNPNANASRDFDLDASEQADLVIKILKLAGISIEDAQLYQAAAQEDQQNIQLENK